MNKSYVYLSIALSIIVLTLLFLIGFSGPPSDKERALISGKALDLDYLGEIEYNEIKDISIENSAFEFEGYGPGKSHKGSFKEYSGRIYLSEGRVAGFGGKINTSSVSTGIERLDSHLKNKDFFDSDKYPQIEFSSIKIDDVNAKGELKFRGITQEISFPIEIGENSLSADFLLDITPFQIEYIGINKDVRLAFNITF